MQDHIPPTSLLMRDAPLYGYRDTCSVDLGPRSFTVDQVISAFFDAAPRWLDGLMELRNTLVKPLGLKTGPVTVPVVAPPFLVGQTIGVFRIIERTETEVVLGENDRHLDFRVSLLLVRTGQGTELSISTLVRMHNLLGRGYFALVRPFHRYLVPIMARNTAQRLLADMPSPRSRL